jgi:ATP-dependent helicase Lhr and Lhr-like helicase
MKKSISSFHPLITRWFLESYGKPTDVQNTAWEYFRSNEHFILSSPTGSGKTFAAFLAAIDNFATGDWETGTLKVLYISPLKALNTDIRNNLIKPINELKSLFEKKSQVFPEIRIAVRSGDTSSYERQLILKKPPEILITTPESLNLMINSKKAGNTVSGIFTGLQLVILDELHVLMPSKRGTHLITAVERLVPLSGEFQRIGLSATVKPLGKAADYLGGYELEVHSGIPVYKKRKVKLIESIVSKKYEISVSFPEFAKSNLIDNSWIPEIVKELKSKIAAASSTLIFTNSRRMTEKITRMINEDEDTLIATAHHGSLSKELRKAVEERMKDGKLKAIVATNSLELGIDIGSLDQVLMIESPFSISSGIQRTGRSGHRVGEISRSIIYPLHGKDFLYSAVSSSMMTDQKIEMLSVPMGALDVIAQLIIGLTSMGEYSRDELYNEVRRSYPYRNLSEDHFTLVLEMLLGRYEDSRVRELTPRLSWDRIDDSIKAKPGSLLVLYMSGGTIPDRGYYTMRLEGPGSRIGELDEEFVWERRVGDIFTLGTQVWKIQNIDHQYVDVVPSATADAMVPFWKGVSPDRSFHFSENICLFLDKFSNNSEEDIKKDFMESHFMSSPAAAYLKDYLQLQKDVSHCELPGRYRLVMEHFSDPGDMNDSKQLVLHTFWGGRINTPYAFALAAACNQKYGISIQVFNDDDSILLDLPYDFNSRDLISLVRSGNLEKLLRQHLETTGYFGGRFRENAARSLLLPKQSFKKRMPLWMNRLRSRKLLDVISGYSDFPVLIETWRSIMQDEFDLKNLFMLLDELTSGVIEIIETVSSSPSPFASGIIHQHTEKFMYKDDTPESGSLSSLNDNYIKDFIHGRGFVPDIPADVLKEFIDKRQRIYPGYEPADTGELLELLKERVFIPLSEWENILHLCKFDISDNLNRKITNILPEGALEPSALALENMDYKNLLDSRDNQAKLINLLVQFFSYYGPMELSFLKNIFGNGVSDWLLRNTDDFEGRLIIINSNDLKVLVCETESLEILLRMKRRKERYSFKPLSLDKYTLFLANYQGVIQKKDGISGLKEVLNILFGYTLKSSLWENAVFPSRMINYNQKWLDKLFKDEGLHWFGSGLNKTSFLLDGDEDLFINPKGELREGIFPAVKGLYGFWDLQEFSKLGSEELSHLLWDHVWSGHVSTDSWDMVRKRNLTKTSNYREKMPDHNSHEQKRRPGRSSFARWKSRKPDTGSWYINNSSRIINPLDLREQKEDKIRQLFLRYGILFREILQREQPGLKWKDLFPVLRFMELSGEIIGGYFFEGIPGLQFASPLVLNELLLSEKENSLFMLNALDPASLCGITIESVKKNLPSRLPTTHLIYIGSKLILVSRSLGKRLEFRISEQENEILEALEQLKNLIFWGCVTSIRVEEINGISVFDSPFLDYLKNVGFVVDLKYLVFRENPFHRKNINI